MSKESNSGQMLSKSSLSSKRLKKTIFAEKGGCLHLLNQADLLLEGTIKLLQIMQTKIKKNYCKNKKILFHYITKTTILYWQSRLVNIAANIYFFGSFSAAYPGWVTVCAPLPLLATPLGRHQDILKPVERHLQFH